MVNRSRLKRKLIIMLGVILLMAFSCGRTGRLTLRADDNGGQIELQEGQSFTVSLQGNPTTGHTWEAVELNERILHQVGEPAFTPKSDAPGAPGVQILRFRAVAEGRTTLRLVYRRSWEDVEPNRAFSVEVIVR